MRPFASLLICAVLFAAPALGRADTRQIDTSHSTLRVFVFKTGLFSFAADNHTINAPIKSGQITDQVSSVTLIADAEHMTVLDRETATDKPAQVQARMLGPDVLDVAQFPTIEFKSTAIEAAASGGWDVTGELTIRGKTRPINLHVVQSEGHYRGSTTLKQTDFGIHPVTIAGGTVKVKDEIRIDFDIVTAS